MQSLVRIKGLEPPRLSASDPKSDVATNYTISAGSSLLKSKRRLISYTNFTLSFVSAQLLISPRSTLKLRLSPTPNQPLASSRPSF